MWESQPLRSASGDSPATQNYSSRGNAAHIVVDDWRTERNTYGPHSALNDLTPEAFRTHWETSHQQLS
ncbi:MAG: hypothetical protein K0U78_20945 [Actinomycetia bacterium]|nr:hypothetical protein [Actinomycetes bacterium]